MNSIYKRDILILALISLLGVTLLNLTSDLMLPGNPIYPKLQQIGYIAAAKNPFGYLEVPYCWRLGIPILANAIPFNLTTSFFLISNIAVIINSVVIFFILLHCGFNREFSYYGVILFLASVWAVRFNLIEFWYPDSTLLLFISLAIWFSLTNKKILFSLTLLIGVFIKETMLVAIPLFYTLSPDDSEKSSNYRKLINTIILALPAVILLAILHLYIRPVDDYNYWGLFKGTLFYRIKALVGNISYLHYNVIKNQPEWLTASINIYRMTAGAFGGLIFFYFLKPKILFPQFKRFGILIILAYLQLLFAVDSERLLALCIIPIIVLTLTIFHYYYISKELGKKQIIIFLILFFIIPLFCRSFYFELYYSSFFQNILSILFLAFIFINIRKKKSIVEKLKF